MIGFFPGSDPEKAKEVVIYSAHYDHVGVDDKGEIFNGSDDNASGTSALLEIAEAFGDGPRPARSVAFLWVSGEEKGLLGSQWFSDHVTLPQGLQDRRRHQPRHGQPQRRQVDRDHSIRQARRLFDPGHRRLRRRQGRGAHHQVRRRRLLLPHRQLSTSLARASRSCSSSAASTKTTTARPTTSPRPTSKKPPESPARPIDSAGKSPRRRTYRRRSKPSRQNCESAMRPGAMSAEIVEWLDVALLRQCAILILGERGTHCRRFAIPTTGEMRLDCSASNPARSKALRRALGPALAAILLSRAITSSLGQDVQTRLPAFQRRQAIIWNRR